MKNIVSNVSANRVLAIVFTLFTLHTGLAAMPDVMRKVSDTAKAEKHDFTAMRDAVDKIYADGMLSTKLEQPLWQNKGSYINLNGLMARVMGQRYMNELVLMDNGHLTFYDETPVDVQPAILQMTKLYKKQREQGKDFLFVLAPIQISKYDPKLPAGYQKDRSNEAGDSLLNALRENGVPVLDLREKMYEQGIDYADAFYKNDHHWTPMTGFWAYGEIIKQLKNIGALPEIDSFYTDPNQYEFKEFKNSFLGNGGRRTGRYYVGIDNFYQIIPRFETNISMKIPSKKIDQSDWFEDAIYNKSLLDQLAMDEIDYFNLYAYDSYTYADNDLTHFYNENAPVQKKALLIGDSFSRITAPLLSLCISVCDKMDMRYYKGDFAAYYDGFDPDITVVLVNTSNLPSSNTTFDFFPDEKV